MMKVNNIQIKGDKFAFDGCHKIYIIENDKEEKEAISLDYEIYPISKLEEIWESSCPLRFISCWNLTKKGYVPQFEDAFFSN